MPIMQTTRISNITDHVLTVNGNTAIAPHSSKDVKHVHNKTKVAMQAADRVFNTDLHEAQTLGYCVVSTTTSNQ